MIKAGELRDRVAIQREQQVKDGAGGFEPVWQTLDIVAAKAVPVGGNERLIAGTLRSRQGWSVMIRYIEGITTADRMVLDPDVDEDENVTGGTILNIHSIEDPDRLCERLLAMCETGTDA